VLDPLPELQRNGLEGHARVGWLQVASDREPEHVAQGELYALVLASVTGRKTWDFDAIYVDQGETVPYQFDFDDIGAAQRRWDKRAAPTFEDTVWPKKPSRLCGWCPFLQRNGGPCDGKQDL